MKEEWRPVKGANNTYYVSNLGRVKSIDKIVHCSDGSTRHYRGKLITQTENKRTIFKRTHRMLGNRRLINTNTYLR